MADIHSKEVNRLLTILRDRTRLINSEVLDPVIPELTLKSIEPILKKTALVRAAYVGKLMVISKSEESKLPSTEDIQELAKLRQSYSELVEAYQALETAIERGYLAVKL